MTNNQKQVAASEKREREVDIIILSTRAFWDSKELVRG
jgi:hypothetical protein